MVCAFALASCGSGGTGRFEPPRERPASFVPEPGKVTSAQRFGIREEPETPPHAVGQRAGAAARSFTWKLPEGWVAKEPTRTRPANFGIAASPEAECYLSMAGGAPLANVNRWRGQLGADPIAGGEFAALPRRPLLGSQALFVEVHGSYRGMGTEGKPDWTLLGLVGSYGGRGAFFKFVGPKDVVAKQHAAFLALAASLAPASGGAAAPGPAAAGGGAGDAMPGMAGARDVPGFKHAAPAHWKDAGPKSMRVVSFTLGAEGKTECYVSMMGGGGGVAANFNRWRGQMGQAPLSASEIDALPSLRILGHDAKWIEIDGSYTGMDGKEVGKASMLALICEQEGISVFVKMIGPSADVKRERDAFVAFCKSLEMGG